MKQKVTICTNLPRFNRYKIIAESWSHQSHIFQTENAHTYNILLRFPNNVMKDKWHPKDY